MDMDMVTSDFLTALLPFLYQPDFCAFFVLEEIS